jgi:phosphatidylinositol alpha-mannosyltransferase
MRLAIVSQPYYPLLGGVTEHVWHLGTELQQRGHDVTVITGGVPHPEDRGLRVLRTGKQIPLTINGANLHVTVAWKLGRWLQQAEQRERFDLVHIHSPLDPILPLVAAKTMRTPKVGTFHTFRENNTLWEAFPGVFRDAAEKLDASIAVSHSADGLVKKYFPNLHSQIIPNGVNTKHFRPDVEPMPLRQDPSEVVILFVGRMDPRKGAKYLFAALPYLEQALPKYRVVVVGTSWMKKYYDAHIPLTLRHRVQFTGYASPEDLPRYYRGADIYTSPATGGESFGIVLLEAMACGTPIVASDIDGYRWVVNPGHEGLLVPPRSPRHLAEALISLAKDPARRQQMGQAGRERAMQFDWARVTDQVEAVYRQVLKA